MVVKGKCKESVYTNFTGDSLLVSDGPKWERNRRLLTPGFHFSVLNGYFEVYNDVADTLLVSTCSCINPILLKHF